MFKESERYDGVMAVITDPQVKSVLLIEELTRSERTGKEIGDYAFPAETREAYEISPVETVRRIFQEEIKLTGLELRGQIGVLSVNELVAPVWHYFADPDRDVTIGTAAHEVANPTWFSLDQISKGAVKVRQGVLEIIQRLQTNQIDPQEFIPTRPRFSTNPGPNNRLV